MKTRLFFEFRMATMAVALMIVCSPQSRASAVAVQAGHLFDAVDGRMRGPTTILINHDKIEKVVSGFVAPASYTLLDERERTVLPGLIDCHVHIADSDNSYRRADPTPLRSNQELALLAAGNAARTLYAGFTTIRVVGTTGGTDVLLKRLIEHGDLPGPRMFVALEALGPTGGHSDPDNGSVDEALTAGHRNSVIDGVDSAIRQVRDHHRRGADLIKLMPGGGVGSIGDDPDRLLMTDAEMKAAIDTAHALGMKVAAHAEGRQPIAAVLAAGVDSIEHGDFADAQSFALMRREKRYLVPTLSTSEALLIVLRDHPARYPPELRKKMGVVASRSMAMMAEAVRAKVPIAFGTDATGLVPHGENAMEFALMTRAGMTNAEAILTATKYAAELIGSSDIGQIVPGRFADLIAVDGDPLDDIDQLRHVTFVMKGGEVIYPTRTSPAGDPRGYIKAPPAPSSFE